MNSYLNQDELKALEKLICKALKDNTYNTATKENLFMVMEIVCNNATREDVHLMDLKYYID